MWFCTINRGLDPSGCFQAVATGQYKLIELICIDMCDQDNIGASAVDECPFLALLEPTANPPECPLVGPNLPRAGAGG
jgi:hypothetical protein